MQKYGPKRAFFPPCWAENSSGIRVNHVCVASSQHITSMHHLISWLYIILSKLISFPVCWIVCLDNMSPLECLMKFLMHKRKSGKKRTAPDKNEQGEIWWLTLQNHPICLCDCCVKLKIFFSSSNDQNGHFVILSLLLQWFLLHLCFYRTHSINARINSSGRPRSYVIGCSLCSHTQS